MKYDAFKNRRVAIFFIGSMDSVPTGLEGWKLTDADAFHQNFEMWAAPGTERIAALFGQSLPGIKQHLANVRETNVGVVGNCLKEQSFAEAVKREYLARGYDVLEIDGDTERYIPCPIESDKVRINWQT